MNESPLILKSFEFSVNIYKLYSTIRKRNREFVISKQLLRSGTSIGANIEEANGTISRADFRNKLYISYKEARETLYWLKLLQAVDIITSDEYHQMFNQCEEITKMLKASINTINKQKASKTGS